jgi:hypothetical protein
MDSIMQQTRSMIKMDQGGVEKIVISDYNRNVCNKNMK